MTDDEKAVIVDVLCGQALADHLGDVRDEERHLWDLLGCPELPYDHPAWANDSAFTVTKARLAENGYELPEHLRGADDDGE